MMNPAHARDCVWIAKGSRLPRAVPREAEVVQAEDGVLLTINPKKARLFRANPTDEIRTEILGFQQTKARIGEAMNNGETLYAVFAEDEEGNRIHEEVVTSSHLADATRKLEAQGLKAGVENPSRTIRRRARLSGVEDR